MYEQKDTLFAQLESARCTARSLKHRLQTIRKQKREIVRLRKQIKRLAVIVGREDEPLPFGGEVKCGEGYVVLP